MTGSSGLWSLAEAAGIVPAPPDDVLAAMLGSWWRLPRSFGCPEAARCVVWTVVAPSPLILCTECALVAFDSVRACAYCRKAVRLAKGEGLFFEMNHGVRVIGRAHRHCAEKARRR
jgi:hypothetical protein